MAVYKRGKFWWISYKVNGKRVQKAMGTVKATAVAVLEKTRVEIRAGRYIDEEMAAVPFEDLAADYLEWAKVKNSYTSILACVSPSVEHFKGRMAHTITEHDVENFRAIRKDTPIFKGTNGERIRSNSTVNHELATLKHIFNKGMAWGVLGKNPAAKVKKLPETKGRTRFLTAEEAETLIGAAPAHLRPIIIMALETGMRRGEILGLKWGDVDMKNGMAYVGETKTNTPRHVPLSGKVRATLAALPRRLGTDYVFTGAIRHTPAEGKRRRPLNQPVGKIGLPFRDVDTAFRNACTAAGIVDFRFHDLRHTAASHMVMAGVPMRTVGEILGHKTATMTDRYSHLTPEHKRDAIEKLSAYYNGEGCYKFATKREGVTG